MLSYRGMGEEKKKGSCSLGALRKPATKHKNRRRRLARSVVEYLTSDSYMYAPLVDGLPADVDASACSPQGASPPAALRGAATLRGRTGYKKGAQKSLLTLPTEELDFDLGKCIDSLAKGTELPVVTQDGNCRIRLVSVYLNKNGKVILRTKKINALVPFATGKESVVHNLHSSTEAKVVTSPEENSSYSIIMATSQGITKLKMKDYVCYRIWITSISQMLMLSTNLSNYELQLYGDN